MSPAKYDCIVIGSSPLMLLQALELADKGGRVCVVEKEESKGGAWKTIFYEPLTKDDSSQDINGDVDVQSVEVACHLIESFPGVYEYLEEATGTKFVHLKQQPVRLHPSGLIVNYFSRILLLASGARMFLGVVIARVNRRRDNKESWNAYINFSQKFRNFVRFQLPLVLNYQPMQGPRDGHAAFLQALLDKCSNAGIEFRTFELVSAIREQGQWIVRGGKGELLEAPNVCCTTSASLKKQSESEFSAISFVLHERVSVVVEVDQSRIINDHSYVAFWKDADVSRISRIDEVLDTVGTRNSNAKRYLIEIKHPSLYQSSEGWTKIAEKLVKAKIVARGSEVHLIGRVLCMATQQSDQLPEGEIATGFWTLHSSGNLAAGVAAWLATNPTPTELISTETSQPTQDTIHAPK